MFNFQGRDAPVLVLIEQTRRLVNGIDISKNQNCEKPNRITFSILIGLSVYRLIEMREYESRA